MREADIALRLARPYQLDLRSRRIARLDFGLYASPGWIEQFGSPRESGDLKNCDVIDWADERPDCPAIRWFTKATDIKRVIFRANLPSDRLTAAREGMGVALGPCLVGDTDPGLVRLLPELELVGPEVWLLVHRELADLARVRVVLDVLAQCARADVSRFAGRTKLIVPCLLWAYPGGLLPDWPTWSSAVENAQFCKGIGAFMRSVIGT
jgi:DNA-binding transcriptional LysR family regulator